MSINLFFILQLHLVNCSCEPTNVNRLSCYQSINLLSTNASSLIANIWHLNASHSYIQHLNPNRKITFAALNRTTVKELNVELVDAKFYSFSIGIRSNLYVHNNLRIIENAIKIVKKRSILIGRGSTVSIHNSEIDYIEKNCIIVEGTLIMSNVTINRINLACICIAPYSELHFKNVTIYGWSAEIIAEMQSPKYSVQGSCLARADSHQIQHLVLKSSGIESTNKEFEATDNKCEIKVAIMSVLSKYNNPNSRWISVDDMGSKELILDDKYEEIVGTTIREIKFELTEILDYPFLNDTTATNFPPTVKYNVDDSTATYLTIGTIALALLFSIVLLTFLTILHNKR